MKIMAPRKGDRTLIFGTGVIGLLALELAALKGAEVSACDINQTRLALAKKLGAADVIDTSDQTASQSNAFDLIYETSGADSALAQAIQLAAPGGKIVILGLPGKEHPVSPDLIVRKELQIMGSMIYTDEFPEAINLLKSGQLQTEPLISEKIPLDALDRALSEFGTPNRVKMLVTIS
jgi:L-iditol 2-dehydrogenase